jgi:hypothetical protein
MDQNIIIGELIEKQINSLNKELPAIKNHEKNLEFGFLLN